MEIDYRDKEMITTIKSDYGDIKRDLFTAKIRGCEIRHLMLV
jgi:hypothetical protein